MPSLEELRESNHESRDDVRRDHVPPSAHEGPSRYPVSFAQSNLAVIFCDSSMITIIKVPIFCARRFVVVLLMSTSRVAEPDAHNVSKHVP